MARYPVAGKVVLITGPARGIGEAAARELHRRGASVALCGIEPERLRALEADLNAGAGGDGQARAAAFDMDVTSMESVERAVEAVVAHFGRIDVCYANAGIITEVASVETITPAAWERVMDVNLNGVFRTLRACQRHVVRTRGYFLVTASTAYGFNSPLQAHYAASKAGVVGLARSFRLEVRWTGADVGVLYPTFVDVPNRDKLAAHEEELGAMIWDGNEDDGAWGAVPLAEVVGRVVGAIEGRQREVVVPRKVSPVVWFPTVLQRFLERSFSDEKLERLAKAARRVAAENARRRAAATGAASQAAGEDGGAGMFV